MAERGVNVGTAYVQIVPSTEGIAGGISKALNGEVDATGKAFGGKLAGVVKKAIAGAGIGLALKSAISEGANLEQSIGGIETLYKQSADAMIENADRAWKTAGMSANTYMETVTSFSASLISSLGGDTEKAVGLANQTIIDMSDNANKMGTDLSAVQQTYMSLSRGLYQTLDNLKLGYGGTKSEMERLLADAEKLTGVKYNIDNLSDVYSAIHVIQQELGITGTTALEGEKTISGSLNALKSAYANFMGNLTLGRNIEESMGNLVDSASTFLFKNLIPAVARVFVALPKAIGQFIINGLPELLASFVIMFNQLASSIDVSGDFVGKALGILTTLSETLLSYSGMFVDAGLRLITNLATGLINGLPALIENLPIIVGNIADIINRNAPKVIKAGIKITKSLAIGIVRAIPTLIKSLPAIFSAMFKVWSAFQWINLGKLAFNKVKNGITSVGKGLINAVKGIIARVRGLFNFTTATPHIKIPHFSITPSGWKVGDLLKGIKPTLGIKWNAEGGIFDRASIIGYGVGEAGREAIVPLDEFWSRLHSSISSVNSQGGGVLNLVLQLDQQTLASSTVNWINGQTLIYGTSPVAL